MKKGKIYIELDVKARQGSSGINYSFKSNDVYRKYYEEIKSFESEASIDLFGKIPSNTFVSVVVEVDYSKRINTLLFPFSELISSNEDTKILNSIRKLRDSDEILYERFINDLDNIGLYQIPQKGETITVLDSSSKLISSYFVVDDNGNKAIISLNNYTTKKLGDINTTNVLGILKLLGFDDLKEYIIKYTPKK